MDSIDARKRQLQSRLDELTARLRRIDDELDQPRGDETGEADEPDTEEVLEDLGAAGLQEIRMVEAALDRIDTGSYGTCVRCGAPISDERLDVLPYTPFCQECAAEI